MSSPAHAFTLALAQAATLGEGLQWHADSGRWWWTDIEGASLHAWTPGDAHTLTVRLPERVGCFVHARSGRLLLAMAKRLAWLTLPDLRATGTVSGEPEAITPLEPRLATRANDGRCDRSGALVFGTLHEGDPQRPLGSLYQYSLARGLRRLPLDGVAIANSICFSPDGRTMYYADSASGEIRCCDYDPASGAVSAVRVFAAADAAPGEPDGAAIDAEGGLWSTRWGAAQVVRFAPDGRLDRVLPLAALQPSCPAFGGAQCDTLYVTSARQDMTPAQLAEWPQSGGLFAQEAVARGLPEVRFGAA